MIKKIIKVSSTYDKVPLHGSLCYDDNSTEGLVQIFHGMAEHRHRYEWFAQSLVSAGYAVLTCDHRGHGDSAVIPGYFADKDGWNVNLQDLHQLTLEALNVIKLPLIIFGHSMGSLVARSYLKSYPSKVTKMILSGSPSDTSSLSAGIILAKLIKMIYGPKHPSKLLDKLSFGSFNKNIENPKTAFDWLSVNEENVHRYIDDKLCGYPFTAQGYLDLFAGIKDVYHTDNWKINDPQLPIAFFSGEKDPCMIDESKLKQAVEHMRALGYQNVSYTLIPNLRHEILNEKERDAVLALMLAFLKQD